MPTMESKMYCIIVKNKIKNGCREVYLKAMLENAKASVESEAGCHVFDVLEEKEEENTFYLYQIYSNPGAVEVHKETPHYLKSHSLINDIIESVSVTSADVLATN
ncbi:MAG: autoinducer 2-degrading protein [Glaciecola sp.]|jgi:autoinducer 2-degrading protein